MTDPAAGATPEGRHLAHDRMGGVLPPDNHVHTQWSWDAPPEASMVRSCEQALAAAVLLASC